MTTPLEQVESKNIDLAKYIGVGKPTKDRKWHQVAAFPAWFQKDVQGHQLQDVTAVYTQRKGYVEVKNSGKLIDGKRKVQLGKAFPSDKPNVLKVKFFPLQPGADYIIEFVDKKYKYAIVGSSSKAYLWILARGRVTPMIRDQLTQIAKRKGYDVGRLES